LLQERRRWLRQIQCLVNVKVDAMRAITFGVVTIYSIFAGCTFYLRDICYLSSRTVESPPINYFLITVGIGVQVSHIILLFCWVLYFKKLWREFVERRSQKVFWLLFLIFGCFSGGGMVRHGALAGDVHRAHFVDNCKVWCDGRDAFGNGHTTTY
jgi:hypothetical protein